MLVNIIKTNKMDRKGLLLGEHTVKIVIAVLALVILIVLAVKLYGTFTEKSDLEKAKGDMENILVEIDVIKNSDKFESNLISLAPKDWYLISYPRKDVVHPTGECLTKDSCLCICNKIDCESQKVCEGFDYKVIVDESDVEISSFYGPDSVSVTHRNTIKFTTSSLEIKLNKEGEDIKIKK